MHARVPSGWGSQWVTCSLLFWQDVKLKVSGRFSSTALTKMEWCGERRLAGLCKTLPSLMALAHVPLVSPISQGLWPCVSSPNTSWLHHLHVCGHYCHHRQSSLSRSHPVRRVWNREGPELDYGAFQRWLDHKIFGELSTVRKLKQVEKV